MLYSKSKIILVAAAGSGKTTHLVKESLKLNNRVLIVTYTRANKDEIEKKIFEQNKYIPPNITVKTWFSFLLEHGVRPYQSYLFNDLSEKPINSMIFVKGCSAQKIKENNKQHYIDNNKIYSDKIAKFTVKCDEESNGCIISRLSHIYESIFIDEGQDLAGYDLEFLKLLFKSSISVTLACDPRQTTFLTNNSPKHKQYANGEILSFFKKELREIEIDNQTLNKNHRSVREICHFSDTLFPDYPPTESGNNNNEKKSHPGVFLVRDQDVERYLDLYKPIQLRYDRKVKVSNRFNVMNFGDSKGLSFDRVLIYPTKKIKKWLSRDNQALDRKIRSKFYVAITRARFSVAILYDYDKNEITPELASLTKKFVPN